MAPIKWIVILGHPPLEMWCRVEAIDRDAALQLTRSMMMDRVKGSVLWTDERIRQHDYTVIPLQARPM